MKLGFGHVQLYRKNSIQQKEREFEPKTCMSAVTISSIFQRVKNSINIQHPLKTKLNSKETLNLLKLNKKPTYALRELVLAKFTCTCHMRLISKKCLIIRNSEWRRVLRQWFAEGREPLHGTNMERKRERQGEWRKNI